MDPTTQHHLTTGDGVRRYRRRTTYLQLVMGLAATTVMVLALLFPQA